MIKPHKFDEDGEVEHGVLFDLAEFTDMIELGCFNNYDGYGIYANSTHELSQDPIYPSMFYCTPRPSGATHILWFGA